LTFWVPAAGVQRSPTANAQVSTRVDSEVSANQWGKKMRVLSFVVVIAAMLPSIGLAQVSGNVVKIAVLNDQSSVFSALGGTEVVRAAELAVKHFGGSVLGKPIQILSADHQNKPEAALLIARQWLDQEGVDAIADMANSAIALGVNTLLGERKRVGLYVSPGTDRYTEADCNGYVTGWGVDSYSVLASSVKSLVDTGSKTFFILSPDYEAGKVAEAEVEKAVQKFGGRVIGKIRSPLGGTDYASFLLQAQSSGADVIQLNLNGPDLVNAAKQIQEFGIGTGHQKIAVSYVHQADTRAVGVDVLQGIKFATPWFWNLDDNSRKFGDEMRKITGNAPGWAAAGTYSAVTNYLKAIEIAGTDDADAVIRTMKGMTINDMYAHNGKLLPNGRVVHDMYLAEVKKPTELEVKDDYFRLLKTIPAEQAFRPLAESACHLKE